MVLLSLSLCLLLASPSQFLSRLSAALSFRLPVSSSPRNRLLIILPGPSDFRSASIDGGEGRLLRRAREGRVPLQGGPSESTSRDQQAEREREREISWRETEQDEQDRESRVREREPERERERERAEPSLPVCPGRRGVQEASGGPQGCPALLLLARCVLSLSLSLSLSRSLPLLSFVLSLISLIHPPPPISLVLTPSQFLVGKRERVAGRVADRVFRRQHD